MLNFSIIEAELPKIRHAIASAVPALRASHVAECFAAGLRYRNNAALLNALRKAAPSRLEVGFDPALFAARAIALGHEVNGTEVGSSIARFFYHQPDFGSGQYALVLADLDDPVASVKSLLQALSVPNFVKLSLSGATRSAGGVRGYALDFAEPDGTLRRVSIGRERTEITKAELGSLRRSLFDLVGGKDADYRSDRSMTFGVEQLVDAGKPVPLPGSLAQLKVHFTPATEDSSPGFLVKPVWRSTAADDTVEAHRDRRQLVARLQALRRLGQSTNPITGNPSFHPALLEREFRALLAEATPDGIKQVEALINGLPANPAEFAAAVVAPETDEVS